MNPDEKAVDLLKKLRYKNLGNDIVATRIMFDHDAREIALICVDELIENSSEYNNVKSKSYWRAVKREIESL